MRLSFRPWLLLVAVLSVAAGSWVLAQQGPTPVLPQAPQNPPPAGAPQSATPKEVPPPPPAGAVAATVQYAARFRDRGLPRRHSQRRQEPAEIRKESAQLPHRYHPRRSVPRRAKGPGRKQGRG